MADLPSSSQSNSMDALTVTREEFRLGMNKMLEFHAQALGNVSGTYTTETVSPTNIKLQGTPSLTDGSKPAADDNSLRIPCTSWVQALVGGAGDITGIDAGPGIAVTDGDTATPKVSVDLDATPGLLFEGAADAGKLKVKVKTDGGITLDADGLSVTGGAPIPDTGGEITGSLTTPIRTLTDAAFDLSTGPYWQCAGGFQVPNPSSAVAGMAGLIRFDAAPTSWSANFKGPGGDMTAIEIKGKAIVPFFVNAADDIYIGWPTNEIA